MSAKKKKVKSTAIRKQKKLGLNYRPKSGHAIKRQNARERKARIKITAERGCPQKLTHGARLYRKLEEMYARTNKVREKIGFDENGRAMANRLDILLIDYKVGGRHTMSPATRFTTLMRLFSPYGFLIEKCHEKVLIHIENKLGL